MDRDRRTYRFLQDTRHGRVALCESDSAEELVEAITAYIAHRLIEREKALAIDYASGGAAQALAVKAAAARNKATARDTASSFSGKVSRAAAFVAEFFGAAAFFALLAVLGAWIFAPISRANHHNSIEFSSTTSPTWFNPRLRSRTLSASPLRSIS